jgi:hypothetical protein
MRLGGAPTSDHDPIVVDVELPGSGVGDRSFVLKAL